MDQNSGRFPENATGILYADTSIQGDTLYGIVIENFTPTEKDREIASLYSNREALRQMHAKMIGGRALLPGEDTFFPGNPIDYRYQPPETRLLPGLETVPGVQCFILQTYYANIIQDKEYGGICDRFVYWPESWTVSLDNATIGSPEEILFTYVGLEFLPDTLRPSDPEQIWDLCTDPYLFINDHVISLWEMDSNIKWVTQLGFEMPGGFGVEVTTSTPDTLDMRTVAYVPRGGYLLFIHDPTYEPSYIYFNNDSPTIQKEYRLRKVESYELFRVCDN